MVINFTVGKRNMPTLKKMRGYLAQSEALRVALLAAVDDDAAFDAVAATYGMPKETDVEGRPHRLRCAQHAAAVPFDVAEKCLAIIKLTAVGAKGNSNVVRRRHRALPGLRRLKSAPQQRQHQPKIHQG